MALGVRSTGKIAIVRAKAIGDAVEGMRGIWRMWESVLGGGLGSGEILR